ncbi:Uncharacterised protein [Mycobacteroides abscessus subsp. abscessus]|nr:Uncharacterised protein [Mycobacteroides abscessus subsp. abscessus]
MAEHLGEGLTELARGHLRMTGQCRQADVRVQTILDVLGHPGLRRRVQQPATFRPRAKCGVMVTEMQSHDVRQRLAQQSRDHIGAIGDAVHPRCQLQYQRI